MKKYSASAKVSALAPVDRNSSIDIQVLSNEMKRDGL